MAQEKKPTIDVARPVKCPYIWNTVETEKPTRPRYQSIDTENEDGTPYRIHLTASDTGYSRIRYFHDCLKEECAAWQDGRCARRGS